MDKAHVEHTVGFVEDQNLHVGKVDGFLVRQVEQAARAGDKHVEALRNGLNLRVHADASEDHRAFQRQVAGVQLEAIVYLGGELACRRQHQYARLARTVAVLSVRMAAREKNFEYGEGKATGLAGSRLCSDHQVASLQHGGNGPLLHRCRLGVTGGLDGTGQSLGETEGSKGHE